MRWKRWSSVALSLCLGCSVPAMSPPVLEDPTPLARCAVQRSAASPLVTEWPASEKAHLESLLATGMVAVAYDGCELRLLETCHPEGDYAFHRTSLSSDTIEIRSVDDLYAKLPLGAASLEGKLASAGWLAIDTTAIGQLRLEGEAALPDTPPCREATHVVRALSVGAFDMRLGGEAEASGGVGVGPAAMGGARRRATKRLRAAGDPKACAETAAQPHPGCQSPLQLFLTPAVAIAPTATPPPPVPTPPPLTPPTPAPVARTTPAPATPMTPAPVKPPRAEPPASVCGRLVAEMVRVQLEPAVPLHLPRGGRRVVLVFANEGDVDLTLPSSSHLTLLDRAGHSFTPEMMPAAGTWRLSVDVPARSRRQVEVIVPPELTEAAELRLAGVTPSASALDECVFRQRLQADGSGPAEP